MIVVEESAALVPLPLGGHRLHQKRFLAVKIVLFLQLWHCCPRCNLARGIDEWWAEEVVVVGVACSCLVWLVVPRVPRAIGGTDIHVAVARCAARVCVDAIVEVIIRCCC